MEENKNKSIGALWLHESKNGNKYFSGQVEIDGKPVKIVVFKNNYKEEDKQPDYKIFESKPLEAKPADTGTADIDEDDELPF